MAIVVSIKAVSKKFNLYASRVAQAAAAFGIGRIVPLRAFRPIGSKTALADVNISIQKGEKVGIIGRNGSGKTTLLRVILGDLQVSSGVISSSDNIQAMMQTGFGFSEDLTGRQNIENSLYYNGLSGDARKQAIQDVVKFVELGDYLDHPLSTYSLGMRARLEFATATAIRPDILVVDEVLGAGDGYFASKCAERMKHLTSNTTLILVSHSMQQIIDYCDRVIWVDQSQVRMDGPAASVIKSYERFMEQQQQLHREHQLASESKSETEPALRLREEPDSVLGTAGLAFRDRRDDSILVKIEKIGFSEEFEKRRSGQVGEDLNITAIISVDSKIKIELVPLILGLDEMGRVLFKGKVPNRVDSASSVVKISMTSRSCGLGVGKYFISLAMLDPDTLSVVCLSENVLEYVVTETNHSDPPRLHLSGAWVADGINDVQPARISAWV